MVREENMAGIGNREDQQSNSCYQGGHCEEIFLHWSRYYGGSNVNESSLPNRRQHQSEGA